jgi:poly(A) polymerase
MAINFIKTLFKDDSKKKHPAIKSCSKRFIQHVDISKNALSVVRKLNEAGFEAYFVGGCVRDLLLNLHPKDFDIATSALPEQVNKLFRNSRLVGRRFRLAHVFFGRELVEVATFRGKVQKHHTETGMIVRDNSYGALEEDAWRRDFTINALYYDIKNQSFIDYVGGLKDLDGKIIRVIGDPEKRYHEDPVRMLRALRLSAKLEFDLDYEAVKPISSLAGLLQNVPAARIFDETLKWFLGGNSFATFKLLRQYGVFAVLFLQTEATLSEGEKSKPFTLLSQGFINSDNRIAEGKTLNPAFLFAVLLWWPFQKKLEQYQQKGSKLFPAVYLASKEVTCKQIEHMVIPRYLLRTIKEIWMLQFRFLYNVDHKKAKLVLKHPRFKIAYDFLLLRAQAGEEVRDLADRWTGLFEKFGATATKIA